MLLLPTLQQSFSNYNKKYTCEILSRLGYRLGGYLKDSFSPYQPQKIGIIFLFLQTIHIYANTLA